jgi:hypothetical protein
MALTQHIKFTIDLGLASDPDFRQIERAVNLTYETDEQLQSTILQFLTQFSTVGVTETANGRLTHFPGNRVKLIAVEMPRIQPANVLPAQKVSL